MYTASRTYGTFCVCIHHTCERYFVGALQWYAGRNNESGVSAVCFKSSVGGSYLFIFSIQYTLLCIEYCICQTTACVFCSPVCTYIIWLSTRELWRLHEFDDYFNWNQFPIIGLYWQNDELVKVLRVVKYKFRQIVFLLIFFPSIFTQISMLMSLWSNEFGSFLWVFFHL